MKKRKREWLAEMALIIAIFALAGCGGKDNRQQAYTPAHEIEDTSVGVCPCCEAEVIYVGDSVAMVKDN